MRRRNYRRVTRWLLGAAILTIVIGAAALLWAAHLKARPVPVRIVEVRVGPVAAVVADSLKGMVSARRRVVLRADTGGTVLRVAVEPGARVRRGDALVTLASAGTQRELELQLRGVDAALSRQQEACAAAELVGRTLAGERELSYHQLISPHTIDATETRREAAVVACESAIARVAYARTSVTLARGALRRTTLRAPFDGVVSSVHVAQGLVELVDTASIYVRVRASAAAAGEITAGLPVRITMAAFAAGPFAGRVIAVRGGDPRNGPEPVTVEVVFDDVAFAATVPTGTAADVRVFPAARGNSAGGGEFFAADQTVCDEGADSGGDPGAVVVSELASGVHRRVASVAAGHRIEETTP